MRFPVRKYHVLAALLIVLAQQALAQEDFRSAMLRACLDSCYTAEVAGDYDMALEGLEEAMRIARADKDTAGIAQVLARRGRVHQRLGDYDAALQYFYEAKRLYEASDDENGLAEALNNIGSIHHYDRDFAKAASFYSQSLALHERHGEQQERAILLNNFGSLYEDRDMPDSALHYLRKALAIWIAEDNPSWVAVTYGNMGSCFDKAGLQDSARHYLRRSLELVPEKNKYHHGTTHMRLGLTYLHDGAPSEAVRYCLIGLATAMELQAMPLEQRSCECLYLAYRAMGRSAESLAMLERLVAVRDSMFGQKRAKELTRIELTHNFERQQLADSLAAVEQRGKDELAYQERIGRERDQKRIFLLGTISVLFLALGLWSRLRYMRRSRNAVARERERSDKLLLNILPSSVADELKENGRAQAREVGDVSILFTDFQGFTQLTEQLSAHELVEGLDTCFRAFDAIAVRHGIEKIKTIGDAYMCAGGLPDWRPQSARDTVHAALDMLVWLEEYNAARLQQGKPGFFMRAGIHTGPVVAGIVGDRKFQYDMWGDTVNIAARMESYGEPGRLNISASTYLLVQDSEGLRFDARGKVMTKGKGELEMYFVEREAPA